MMTTGASPSADLVQQLRKGYLNGTRVHGHLAIVGVIEQLTAERDALQAKFDDCVADNDTEYERTLKNIKAAGVVIIRAETTAKGKTESGDQDCAPSPIAGANPSASGREKEHLASNTAASRDVLAERQRQVQKLGWTAKHDDDHEENEMALAAAAYAMHAYNGQTPLFWPWDWMYWKPKSRREDLVRAGALILAEIERLDRKTQSSPPLGSEAGTRAALAPSDEAPIK